MPNYSLSNSGGGTRSYNDFHYRNGGGSVVSARSGTAFPGTGKFYWELGIFERGGTNANCRTGFANSSHSLTGTLIGNNANSVGWSNTEIRYNNAQVFDTPNFFDLSWFCYAYDCATRKLWVGTLNATTGARTWHNSGDPTAGTGNVYTLASDTWYLAASIQDSDADLVFMTGFHTRLTKDPPTDFEWLDDFGLTAADILFQADNSHGGGSITESGKRYTGGGSAVEYVALVSASIRDTPVYWEIENVTDSTIHTYGLARISKIYGSMTTGLQGEAAAYRQSNGNFYIDGVSQGTYSTSTAGDTIMLAFDPASGKIWCGKNGTWFNSGDPAAGTGNVGTLANASALAFTPGVGLFSSGSARINTVASDFNHTKPTGFQELGFTPPTEFGSGEGHNILIIDELRPRKRRLWTPNLVLPRRRLAA